MDYKDRKDPLPPRKRQKPTWDLNERKKPPPSPKQQEKDKDEEAKMPIPRLMRLLYIRNKTWINVGNGDLSRRLSLMLNTYMREQQLSQVYGDLQIEIHNVGDAIRRLQGMHKGIRPGTGTEALQDFCQQYIMQSPERLRRAGYAGILFQIDRDDVVKHTPRELGIWQRLTRHKEPALWRWQAYLTGRVQDDWTYLITVKSILDNVYALYDAAREQFQRDVGKHLKEKKIPVAYEYPDLKRWEEDHNYQGALGKIRGQLSEIRMTSDLGKREVLGGSYYQMLVRAVLDMEEITGSVQDEDLEDFDMKDAIQMLELHMGASSPVVVKLKELERGKGVIPLQPEEPKEELDAAGQWRVFLAMVRGRSVWARRHWFIEPSRFEEELPSLQNIMWYWNSKDCLPRIMEHDDMQLEDADKQKILKVVETIAHNSVKKDDVWACGAHEKMIRLADAIRVSALTTMANDDEMQQMEALALLCYYSLEYAKPYIDQYLPAVKWRTQEMDVLRYLQPSRNERLALCNLQLFTADKEEDARHLGPSFMYTIIPQLAAIHPQVLAANMHVMFRAETGALLVAKRPDRGRSADVQAGRKLPSHIKKEIYSYLRGRWDNNPLMSRYM